MNECAAYAVRRCVRTGKGGVEDGLGRQALVCALLHRQGGVDRGRGGGGEEGLQLALAAGEVVQLAPPRRMLVREVLQTDGEARELRLSVARGATQRVALVPEVVGEGGDAS